jgi:hypothetical protein
MYSGYLYLNFNWWWSFKKLQQTCLCDSLGIPHRLHQSLRNKECLYKVSTCVLMKRFDRPISTVVVICNSLSICTSRSGQSIKLSSQGPWRDTIPTAEQRSVCQSAVSLHRGRERACLKKRHIQSPLLLKRVLWMPVYTFLPY